MGPAYARLDVGLELFQPDAKHMPMPNLGLSKVTKNLTCNYVHHSREHQLYICSDIAQQMISLCQAEPNPHPRFRFSSLSSSIRMYFICIAYALLKSFLGSLSSKRLNKTVAGVKGKGKHSISLAYALLTHFTVLAAVTRRSDRIAAK